MKKRALGIFAVAALAAPALGAEVVGVGNFSHIVGNLERSVEFYGTVLGLEPNVAPTEWSGNPAIMKLGDTPGAESRIATFRIPGSELGVELIDYRNIDRRPQQTRFQDPGAAVLQLRLRDLDSVLARLATSAGQIWTPSGEPVALGANRIIFIKDPDGFFVELIELGEPPSTPAGNVLGASFEIMIRDSDENARFYSDGFGVDVDVADAFDSTELLTDTVSALGSSFRRSVLTIPGTSVTMAFLEFRDIDRKPMRTGVQDPGTPILQLFVDDVPALTERLRAAGGVVITSGGVPVDLGGGRLLSIVRDPSNLFLELIPRRGD